MPFSDKLWRLVGAFRNQMTSDADKASVILQDHADHLLRKVVQDLDDHLDRRIAEQEQLLLSQSQPPDALLAPPPAALPPPAETSQGKPQQPAKDDWVVRDDEGASELSASGEAETPAPAAEATDAKRKRPTPRRVQ